MAGASEPQVRYELARGLLTLTRQRPPVDVRPSSTSLVYPLLSVSGVKGEEARHVPIVTKRRRRMAQHTLAQRNGARHQNV